MAVKSNTTKLRTDAQLREKGYITDGAGHIEGFTVTATIGTVQFGRDGKESPFMAACAMIENARGAGEYHFPHENGGTVYITIPADQDVPPEGDTEW